MSMAIIDTISIVFVFLTAYIDIVCMRIRMTVMPHPPEPDYRLVKVVYN